MPSRLDDKLFKTPLRFSNLGNLNNFLFLKFSLSLEYLRAMHIKGHYIKGDLGFRSSLFDLDSQRKVKQQLPAELWPLSSRYSARPGSIASRLSSRYAARPGSTASFN